jgi:hypothetical protein
VGAGLALEVAALGLPTVLLADKVETTRPEPRARAVITTAITIACFNLSNLPFRPSVEPGKLSLIPCQNDTCTVLAGNEWGQVVLLHFAVRGLTKQTLLHGLEAGPPRYEPPSKDIGSARGQESSWHQLLMKGPSLFELLGSLEWFADLGVWPGSLPSRYRWP